MNNYPKVSRWAVATLLIAGLMGGLSLARPALAQQTLQTLASIVTCSSTLACSGGTNNSTGPGVQGISFKGKGVIGQTKFNSTSTSNAQSGALGQDLSTSGSYDFGVRGTSTRGTGVSGSSTDGSGVSGSSSIANGVSGTSPNGSGVYGTSTNGYGIQGNSSAGPGVNGFSVSGGGVVGVSSNNDGMDATTYNPSATKTPRSGIFGYDASTDGGSKNNGVGGYSGYGTGVSGSSSHGYGVDAVSSGGYALHAAGVNGIAVESTGFYSIYATGSNGQHIFDVDFNGDIHIPGQIYTGGGCNQGCAPKKASTGKRLVSYTPHESVPTMEDFGQAQLLNGQTYVRMDPAFVNGIDHHAAYLVFITPQGDSNGVFVSQQSLAGFAVRENRGGHSTLSFSYRIVAKPFGSTEPRLPMVDIGAKGHMPPMRPLAAHGLSRR